MSKKNQTSKNMRAAANLAKLPDFCYVHCPAKGKPLRIFKGERGYHAAAHSHVSVDEINGLMGVTFEQEEAMLWGSMFGWHTPAADPETWENDAKFQAKLLREGKRSARQMRENQAKLLREGKRSRCAKILHRNKEQPNER